MRKQRAMLIGGLVGAVAGGVGSLLFDFMDVGASASASLGIAALTGAVVGAAVAWSFLSGRPI